MCMHMHDLFINLFYLPVFFNYPLVFKAIQKYIIYHNSLLLSAVCSSVHFSAQSQTSSSPSFLTLSFNVFLPHALSQPLCVFYASPVFASLLHLPSLPALTPLIIKYNHRYDKPWLHLFLSPRGHVLHINQLYMCVAKKRDICADVLVLRSWLF